MNDAFVEVKVEIELNIKANVIKKEIKRILVEWDILINHFATSNLVSELKMIRQLDKSLQLNQWH